MYVCDKDFSWLYHDHNNICLHFHFFTPSHLFLLKKKCFFKTTDGVPGPSKVSGLRSLGEPSAGHLLLAQHDAPFPRMSQAPPFVYFYILNNPGSGSSTNSKMVNFLVLAKSSCLCPSLKIFGIMPCFPLNFWRIFLAFAKVYTREIACSVPLAKVYTRES